MANDWFADNAPKAGEADWFADNAPKAEPGRLSRFGGGVKEGLGSVVEMVTHPIETAKAFGGGVIEAAKAVPDVARNLMDSETRGATLRGFGQGALEGASGVSVDEAQHDPWTAAGRFVGGVVIPAVTLKAAPKVPGVLRGTLRRAEASTPGLAARSTTGGATASVSAPAVTDAAAWSSPARGTLRMSVPDDAPKPKPSANAGGRLVREPERPAKVPPTASVPQAVAEALEEIAPAKPRGAPGVSPAAQAAQTDAKVAKARALQRRAAPETKTELPASWQKLAEGQEPKLAPAAPSQRPMSRLSREEPIWEQEGTPNLRDVKETRRAMGSREAGNEHRQFQALANELGVPVETVIRDLTGGPSRIPLAVESAIDDTNYMRRLADERGFMDPKLALTLGAGTTGAVAGSALAVDGKEIPGGIVGALGGMAAVNPVRTMRAIQQLRMTAMLSGAAVPKSAAGNVGAFLTAAAERGSLAPIKEALRVPTNLRNAAKGFKGGANPSGQHGMGKGMGKINLPGRIMGALDEASTQALQRAGLSLDEAQRLLLTRPKPFGDGRMAKALDTPVGRFVMPFQRTPMNTFTEGVESLMDLAPGSGASRARRGLTVGAGLGGAVAGSETDHPLALAILAALAGPRAIPFALGAASTAGPKVIDRVSVGLPEGSWKDILEPLRPIDRPALLRLLETGGR